jgi:aarF domain-containing kinase
MLTLDFSFWKSRFLRWFRNLRATFHLGGGVPRNGGFEDELERTMRDFAKDNLGVNVGEGVLID